MSIPSLRQVSAILALLILFVVPVAHAQSTGEAKQRRHHLGSSVFVSFNALLERAPDFYQLNYGYRLTERDVVSVEAITWLYWEPLGIPYGPSKGAAEEEYPGYVRSFGVGLAYQRFIWGNLYTALHALPLLQHYMDEQDVRIQRGFQLFMTYRIGYHLPLFGDAFFLEPSIAATYWPVNTNVPDAFAAKDSAWPDYFLFEPGLHFGVRF